VGAGTPAEKRLKVITHQRKRIQQLQFTDHSSQFTDHRSQITDNRSQATDHEPVNGILFRNAACFRETSQQAVKRNWPAVVERGPGKAHPFAANSSGKQGTVHKK
jgi:hypothetical protein